MPDKVLIRLSLLWQQEKPLVNAATTVIVQMAIYIKIIMMWNYVHI